MKFDWNEIKEYINNTSDQSEIYIGCDSEKYKKNEIWYASYTTVIVIHVDGCRGCKIFGEITKERDYDQNVKKPSMRLMNEVYKVVELFQNLHPIVKDRNIEIHLDINPDEKQGSNHVVNQAMGYVKGVCNITPKIKPDAFAASKAADKFNTIS